MAKIPVGRIVRAPNGAVYISWKIGSEMSPAAIGMPAVVAVSAAVAAAFGAVPQAAAIMDVSALPITTNSPSSAVAVVVPFGDRFSRTRT